MDTVQATTLDLLDYINQSPTPVHCVQSTRARLEAAGFVALRESEAWTLQPLGRYLVIRNGAILAFRVGSQPAAEGGFRIIGAHTDSPGLRLKPNADVTKAGYACLGVEVYGGCLTYTWLDRDLGLAGVVMSKSPGAAPKQHLVRLTKPRLRIPSLAIHLNRDVVQEGLKLNAQKHLAPLLACTEALPSTALMRDLLAAELAIDAATILSFDLLLYDLTPATCGGLDDAFVYAPRLDNQAMCHAATVALRRHVEHAATNTATALVCLYDHEEVGSLSTSGAAGSFCEAVMRRIAESEGPAAKNGALARAAARSIQLSADMAHAVHPNYEDRHEPKHMPMLNGGPVIKVNHNQRYSTTAQGAALFESLCQDAQVPCQSFVIRSDLGCGSTIGPIASARLGIETVDVGNPMLSMHSIREQGGALDPERMVAVMERFLGCVWN